MAPPSWLAKVARLRLQGEPLAAVAALEAGLAGLPSYVDGWNLQGVILCDDLQRYEEAIASFDEALKYKPDSHVAWHMRGVALAYVGIYEDAIFSFDKSLKYKLDYLSWSDRGIVMAKLERYEEAIASFDEALKHKSDFPEAWYNRGLALENLRHYEAAIVSYGESLKHKPDFPEAWVNRGLVLGNLGHYEEAIASYDEALKYKPNDPVALASRGFSFLLLGQHEEAIAGFDEALKHKPDFYLVWQYRGRVLNDLGRSEAAIDSCDEALRHKLDDPEAWIVPAEAICRLSIDRLTSSNLLTAIRPPLISILQQPERHITALQEALPHLTSGSLAWGHIHLELGNAYFKHGKAKPSPRPYWRDAVRSYQTALSNFTSEAMLERRLEVLQGMIRALLALEDISAARDYQQEGRTLFEQLRSAQPEPRKPAFEAKFSSFSHREIDLLMGENNPVAALEQAEFYKNRCLTWILDAWQETVLSPSMAQMQTLCNTHTAMLYWHLSPDNLTTFILIDGQPPVVLASDRRQQSHKFEQWMQDYDRHYRDYASQKKVAGDRANHPWRKTLEPQLDQLRQILQIDRLCEQLPATVDTLILLPHRDLHRFPIHALFPDRFTTAYLPSCQIGLNLRDRQHTAPAYLPLLNIDDPQTEQDEMPFAQLESAIVRHLAPNATHISPANASVDNVIQALQNPHRTFHFTGHGAYNSRQPEASAIALTDGLLTAKRINKLDLSSYSLIGLAACETAVTGKDDITTEYVGLATAFLKAGAANVLSTLWQVDEISSAWLMIRFYQYLLAGDPPILALKQAQHWLRTITLSELIDWISALATPAGLAYRWQKELEVQVHLLSGQQGTMEPADRPYHHPFHWAAYTLTGQPL